MLEAIRRAILVLRQKQVLHRTGVAISVTVIGIACYVLYHMLRGIDTLEVTEAINFAVQGYNPLGKFSVAMRCPFVFWEDQNNTSVNLTPVWNGAISQFDGMTAPVEDAVITITGPCTSMKVESLYNGSSLEVPNWFQYAGALTAGQTLIVDLGKWTLTGTGGLVVNYSYLTYAGGARWFTLVPSPFGQGPGVKVTASGTSGATNINLTAKRKYLVG